jgi:lipopolysaccharide export system protein LptA
MCHRLLKRIAFLTCIPVGLLFALTSDNKEIIHVKADTANISQLEHKGDYKGHVELTQGTTHLVADNAETLGNDKNQLIQAIARGAGKKQAHFSTKTAEDKPILHAFADTITYYPLKHLIVLEGNAQVRQGKNTFSAAKIKYDTLKRHVLSESKGSKRTTIIIYPEKKKS